MIYDGVVGSHREEEIKARAEEGNCLWLCRSLPWEEKQTDGGETRVGWHIYVCSCVRLCMPVCSPCGYRCMHAGPHIQMKEEEATIDQADSLT